MKKQYIQPAFLQVTMAAKTFMATSLPVDDNPQNGVSGDVKEWEWDDVIGDVDIWDDKW